jgi:MFS family permease
VPGSERLFIDTGIAFATALLPMALTRVPNPDLGPRHRFGLVRLYRISPLGVVCCLTSGLLNIAFYALAPVYLQRMGHSAGTAAAFVSVTMVAGLLVQYPVGMLAARFGRRPVTLAVLGLAMALALELGLASHMPILVLMLLGFLFAGVTAPLYGLGAGQTNDHVDRSEFVGASGGLLFAWSIGASIGPGMAGAGMGPVGPVGLFVYLAGVLVVVGFFTLARMQIRPGVPRRRQSAFVPATVAPPRLAELAQHASIATAGQTAPARGERPEETLP